MWEWLNKLKPKKVQNSVSLDSDEFLKMLGIDIGSVDKNKLSEITYFTCLRLLSESIGKLPLKLYRDTNNGLEKATDHNLYTLLKMQYNPYMTSSTFWSTVEANKNHYGNAYVYVNTERDKVKDLWILPSEHVQIWIDNAGIFQRENAIWYIWEIINLVNNIGFDMIRLCILKLHYL